MCDIYVTSFIVIMIRKLYMPASAQSQTLASIFIFLGVALIWVFGPPLFVTVIFMVLCVTWSASVFISIFRGSDEMKSAGIRYGLAIASGVGVPLSLAFVMLMVATPGIQGAIANIAAFSNSGLSPASIGFGLGVTFTVVVLCTVFVIGHWVWWASKR